MTTAAELTVGSTYCNSYNKSCYESASLLMYRRSHLAKTRQERGNREVPEAGLDFE